MSWLPCEKGLDPLAWRDRKVVSWSQIVQSRRKDLDPGWGKLKSCPVWGYWSSSVGIYVPTNIWYLKYASEWISIEAMVYKAQSRAWLWTITRLFQHRWIRLLWGLLIYCFDMIIGQGNIFFHDGGPNRLSYLMFFLTISGNDFASYVGDECE